MNEAFKPQNDGYDEFRVNRYKDNILSFMKDRYNWVDSEAIKSEIVLVILGVIFAILAFISGSIVGGFIFAVASLMHVYCVYRVIKHRKKFRQEFEKVVEEEMRDWEPLR